MKMLLRRWWKDLQKFDRVNTTSWSNVAFGRPLTEEEHLLWFMVRTWGIYLLRAWVG